jgi:lipopolysaccharide cholinephosphotransferase
MKNSKEMSLKDIQNVSLDILKAFHNFCVSKGIRYSLGYGTLIGAIRHKGLIPWDDDIDVVMLRKDYDKFIKLFQDTGKYKLFCAERRNMFGAIARLCEMKQTRVKTSVPLFTENTGVWIDIFPLDYIEDDREKLIDDMQLVLCAHRETLSKRIAMRNLRNEVSGFRSLYHWIKMRIRYRKNVFHYVDEHLAIINRVSSNTGTLICQFGYPTYNERDVLHRTAFDNVKCVPVEDSLFYVMEGYDEWLRNIYGDYMKLPPEKDRNRGHGSNCYIWVS